MDEELKNRFFQLKLHDLLSDSTRPYPTMIIERERPEIVELIRKFCLFSVHMKPYSCSDIKFTRETLEIKPIKDYGDLYILVNLN